MSRKPEQLAWDNLRLKSGSRILFQRHEDRLSGGVPDLSGIYSGTQFWCELKASRGLERIVLRTRQVNWMAKRSESGVPCILLARREPDEWAGCIVRPESRGKLLAGINFGDLAFLGRSDVDPLNILVCLLGDYGRNI